MKENGLSEYKGEAGIYKIILTATDIAGNVSEEVTHLYVLDVREKLTVELGTTSLSADKFIKSDRTGIKLTYAKKFNINKDLQKS